MGAAVAPPRPVCRSSRCRHRAGFSCSAACWARAWRPLLASVHAARASRLRRFRRARVALYHPFVAACIFDELARASTRQDAPTHPACETAAAWLLPPPLHAALAHRLTATQGGCSPSRQRTPTAYAVRRGACAPLHLTPSESHPGPLTRVKVSSK